MTQDEIIDMFRMSDKDLDVEEIVNFAVKWEREACAKLCDEATTLGCEYWSDVAEAIRARGETTLRGEK